jgi:hypothetical protein
MWRKTLLVTAVLCGSLSCRALLFYSPPPPWVIEAEAEVRRTRHAFFDRASELVAGLDDPAKESATVALALTHACLPEYHAYADARSALLGMTDQQRAQSRRALESPKEKVRAALPVVLAHRSGKTLSRRSYPG